MNVLIFVSSRERLWGREYSISRRTGQPYVRPASDLGPACPRNGLRPLPPMRRQAHCWFIPAGRRPAASLKETKMTINVRDKTTARLLGSAFALALAASPLSLTLDRGGAHLGSHAAFAKDGGGSSGGDSGSAAALAVATPAAAGPAVATPAPAGLATAAQAEVALAMAAVVAAMTTLDRAAPSMSAAAAPGSRSTATTSRSCTQVASRKRSRTAASR